MSHLQPNFIAKAKARAKQSKIPQRMSDSLIHREASRFMVLDPWIFGELTMRYMCTFMPNYRQFTLRK